ncbi:MAG: isoprenylcysteine carboxylmethyltransferase family protein [Chloroflexota bacterium]|nr:isoprenylcysteine carboxylmethyltransferase family protein [Chloroflexota bacterium]
MITPVIAGLDERFGWSPDLGLVVHLVGLALLISGQGLFTWSMVSNPFFSTGVRIQMDRDHTVSTSGPYKYVRHPGYTGYITFTIGTSLLLGSFWALIPAGIIAVLLIIRTVLEDKTLLEELPGYQAYANRVSWRLLPGFW